MNTEFFVDYSAVLQRIDAIDPVAYARNRNYLSGEVSYLGPFIAHGIVDTRLVAQSVLARSSAHEAEKFLSELAWREFFHRVWQSSSDAIFSDLRTPQQPLCSDDVPAAIVAADTGIAAIDAAIAGLYDTGYMHNHARLWTASLACNIARCHWYQAARWMYYHLLDGDLASNTLSWQWVAGSFSQRKYIANQLNINRFSESVQRGSYLDVDYETLAAMPVPDRLARREALKLCNQFPSTDASPVVGGRQTVLLYSIWNLDPQWHSGEDGLRILLIEPDMHREFALSPRRWHFVRHWAQSIDGLQVFVGSVAELFPAGVHDLDIVTREYPATRHWPGVRESRNWCFAPPGRALTSFSRYWKDARRDSGWFER